MNTRLFEIDDKVTVVYDAWSKLLGSSLRKRAPQRLYGQLIEYRVVGRGKFPIDNVSANTLIVDPALDFYYAINECNLQKSVACIDVIFQINGQDVTAKLSVEIKKAVLAVHLEVGQ